MSWCELSALVWFFFFSFIFLKYGSIIIHPCLPYAVRLLCQKENVAPTDHRYVQKALRSNARERRARTITRAFPSL